MKNEFNINFGNMRYGWQQITLSNNNKQFFNASASYAFSPYYELKYLINFLLGKQFLDKRFRRQLKGYHWFDNYYNTLTKLRNGEYNYKIDQEGYDGVIQFKIRGDSIFITTNTLKDSKKESYITGGRKRTIKFNKNEVINKLLSELLNLQKRIIKYKWEEPIWEICDDDEYDVSMHFDANKSINKIFKHIHHFKK